MTKEKKELDLSNLSTNELESLLEKKRQEEAEHRRKEREKYESDRNKLVHDLCNQAKEMSRQLARFKLESMKRVQEFHEKAKSYGDIRSNSKGGFSLRDAQQLFKIAYERNIMSEYDERANMAEAKMREFLEDKVKARDKKTFRMVMSLITRNKKTGDFNPVSINSLLAIEDNYDDPRWKEALKLFRESYQVRLISMSLSFYEKDQQGRDSLIPLSFSRI